MSDASIKPAVCFLTGTLNAFAGAERMAAVIANELARRGYRVHILSLWDRDSCFELEAALRHDALFAQRPSFKRAYLATVLGIRRYLRQHRVDVLIEVDTMLTLFTLPACVGLGVRRIAWEHCNFDQDLGRRARQLARRLAVRTCQHVVVLTQRDRDKWVRGLGARNVVAIPNALPFAMPAEPAPRTAKVALAVGRLTYAKGFDVLLRAWQGVAQRYPDWRLDIVGDGELRDELVALRDRLGLSACVRFLPPRRDLSEVYRGASLFCLSSRYEGFGLVLIEAMAFGLPIVATDCETGPRELLCDHTTAMLAAVDDVRGLADGICYLITSSSEAAQMARHAIDMARSYDVSNVISTWFSLLRVK